MRVDEFADRLNGRLELVELRIVNSGNQPATFSLRYRGADSPDLLVLRVSACGIYTWMSPHGEAIAVCGGFDVNNIPANLSFGCIFRCVAGRRYTSSLDPYDNPTFMS